MAITGFTVEYGDTIFSDIQTLNFRQRAFRDESNTDIVFVTTRHHFSTYSWQNVDHTMGPMDKLTGQGKAGTVAAITQSTVGLTLRDRQDYKWLHDGNRLLSVKYSPNGVQTGVDNIDVNNGPKVVDISYSEVSPGAIRMEVIIELSYLICGSVNTIDQNTFNAAVDKSEMVLSNRWSVTDQVDADQFWISSVEGTLRVKHKDAFPMCYRELVVPPLRQNYQRVAQAFTQSADGLSLRYQIADRQRHAAPPFPAVEWSCKHTEMTPKFGYKTYSTFMIALKGAPGTKKSALFVAASRAAEARLGKLQRDSEPPADPSDAADAEGPPDRLGEGTTILPISTEYDDQLDDNTITLMVAIERLSGTDADNPDTTSFGPITKYLGLQIQRTDKVFENFEGGYDRRVWPRPGLFDSVTPAGIFATYLQNPCDNTKGVTPPVFCGTVEKIRPERDDSDQEQVGDDQDQGQGGDIQNDPNSGVQQRKAWYSYLESSGEYKMLESGWVGLPLANPSTEPEAGEETPRDTMAHVKLHAGVWQAEFYVHHERASAWPKVLNPTKAFTDERGITYFPIDCRFVPNYPLNTPTSKTRKYSIEATYIFSMSRGPDIGDKLATGHMPIEADTRLAFFKANEETWLEPEAFLGLNNQGGQTA